MRALWTLLLMLASVAGCLSGTPSDCRDNACPPEEGDLPVPGQVVQVDAERWSGEPSIVRLQDGTLLITGVSGYTRYAEDPSDAPCRFGQSYLWRSVDDGATWTFVGLDASPHPCVFYRNAVMGIEGDLARDDEGRAYFVDLTFFPGVNGLSVSEDSGATWTAVQNPAVGAPATDRPWVAATGDGEVFVKYLTQASSPIDPAEAAGNWRVARSTDAGMTFLEDVSIPDCGQADMHIDPHTHDLLVPCTRGGSAWILRTSTGAPMAWETVEGVPLEGQAAGGFPGVAVAGPGQYVLTWVEHHDGTNQVRMTTSSDAGATWAPPVRLSPPGTTASFAWVDADAEGRVAVVWYQAPGDGDPNDVDAPWHAMHASFRLARDGTPTTPHLQRISEEPVHVGSICDAGLGCVLGGRSEDRRLLDFFEVDLDAGVSHVTWTNTQTDVPTIWYGQVRWPDA